jgi:hypothetical protein
MKPEIVILPKLGANVATDPVSGRVNLTDIWKAAKGPYNQRPYDWMKLPTAVKYLAATARKVKGGESPLYETRAGRNGGTYAHPLVALEYARYLNADLAVAVNAAFFQHVEEELDPELKAERAIAGMRRRGWTDEHIEARLKGVVARNALTELCGQRGVEGKGFSTITNATYTGLLGGTAEDIRRDRGLPEKANVRNALDPLELKSMEFGETLAAVNIRRKRAWGTAQCADECHKAGLAVRSMVQSVLG